MSVKYETMNYKVYGGRRGPERFRGIRPTSVLAILGLVTATAQCSIQARPADNSDPTSTFPRPRETFTPVPTPVHIEGSSWQTDEILAFGRALGGGGVGRTDATYANDFLVRKLYEDDGLRVLVDGVRTNQGEPLLTQVQVLPDGTRICLPNSPVRIFDPDLPPEEGHERLFDANFIRYYGFREPQEITFQTVPAVSLDALADNLICVNTIAAAGRINVFGVREGTVMTVLLDKETGEIYGGFRSVFGAGDILGFDQTTGKLTVNGQSVWFGGPGMLQLTPTPTFTPLSTETLTPTPRPEFRPSDITNEDRVYFRDRGQGRHFVPYGLYYSPPPYGDLSPDPEGAKRWSLSGILLEPPQLRETNLLEFKIGVPDSVGGFSVLNILQRVVATDPRDSETLVYFPAWGPRSPAGGYNEYGATQEMVPLNEVIGLYERAVGKQIVIEIDFNESEYGMISYLDSYAQGRCGGSQACIELAEELKGHYGETRETFGQIRNSSHNRYDGKNFWVLVRRVLTPRVLSD